MSGAVAVCVNLHPCSSSFSALHWCARSSGQRGRAPGAHCGLGNLLSAIKGGLSLVLIVYRWTFFGVDRISRPPVLNTIAKKENKNAGQYLVSQVVSTHQSIERAPNSDSTPAPMLLALELLEEPHFWSETLIFYNLCVVIFAVYDIRIFGFIGS